MNKEILNQTLELFDSPEKWNAFVEMANQKETFKAIYFSKVKQLLLKYFNDNPVEGWSMAPWGNHNFDIRWYLTAFGKNSLAIAIGWTFEFHLHLEDTNNYNTTKIDDLLKSKYGKLLTGFDRIDRQYEQNTKAMENRNYSFGSPYDCNFDNNNLDRLAWFAGNETGKFAEQIIAKVERFRRDIELTQLLSELNREAKIVKP